MKTFRKIIAYNRSQFLIVLIILFTLSFLYWGYGQETVYEFKLIGLIRNILHHKWIWGTFDPIAGLGTLILSLFVLYNQGKAKYFDSLEKRLSVEFSFNGDVIMKIKEAYLSGESDIRAWAQQLGGRQLAGRDLKFDIVYETLEEGVYKQDKEINFLHYKIKVFLQEDPRNGVVVESLEEKKIKTEK